jgi:hypothetical protein
VGVLGEGAVRREHSGLVCGQGGVAASVMVGHVWDVEAGLTREPVMQAVSYMRVQQGECSSVGSEARHLGRSRGEDSVEFVLPRASDCAVFRVYVDTALLWISTNDLLLVVLL